MYNILFSLYLLLYSVFKVLFKEEFALTLSLSSVARLLIMSSLVQLRFSQNNFNSSNLFQSLRDFHSLVVIVRYFEAPLLGS